MEQRNLRIDRQWAMPNKWTFTIKPISELLREEVVGGKWCDPFAGMNSPALVTNDLRPEMPTTHHMEALDFLHSMKTSSFDGVLFDPPCSPRQVRECYDNISIAGWGGKWDGRSTFWSETLDECSRILKTGGKLICFGWSSMGGGKSRGFTMTRVLLVPHGGRRNDTIVTVETRTH